MPITSRPEDPWLIRSCFSDDAKWEQLVAEATAPVVMFSNEFFANFKPIDDRVFDGKLPLEVVNALPDDYPQYFVLIVDEASFAPEFTVLVVSFLPQFDESYDTPPRNRVGSQIQSFRAIPSSLQSITNNLSIGNMEFEEFAESVDDDGVFRGFPQPE